MPVSDGGRVSWRRALAWRMARHHLVQRAAPADLALVTGEICGLHAQVLSSAELSLWARIDGLPRDAVREALWTHRSLVKLWAMRGTLHLLPAAELGIWLAAFSTLPRGWGSADRADIDAITGAVARALDGRVLTRQELADEVGRLTGSPEYAEWLRSSWGWALKSATFEGLVCFAPSEGTQVRFTSPASWVRDPLDRPATADALAEVGRRFLHAYGPATAGDLGHWWVESKSGRRIFPMLEALGGAVVQVDVDGSGDGDGDRQPVLALAADLPALAAARPRNVARLLPAFDPWVIAMARREPMIDPRHVSRVFRQQGWVSPVILMNGRIVGVWRHTVTGRRLTVELEPFDRLPAWARWQLAAETRRLARFLECEPPRERDQNAP